MSIGRLLLHALKIGAWTISFVSAAFGIYDFGEKREWWSWGGIGFDLVAVATVASISTLNAWSASFPAHLGAYLLAFPKGFRSPKRMVSEMVMGLGCSGAAIWIDRILLANASPVSAVFGAEPMSLAWLRLTGTFFIVMTAWYFLISVVALPPRPFPRQR